MFTKINASILLFLFLALSALGGIDIVSVISESNVVRFEIKISESIFFEKTDGYTDIRIDGCGFRGETGGPNIPGHAFFVAIPDDSEPVVRLRSVLWSEWQPYLPTPIPARIIDGFVAAPPNTDLYTVSSGGTVVLLATAIFRNVNIAMIDLLPVEYDPQRGIRYMRGAIVEVRHSGGEAAMDERCYHPIFERLFASLLVNPDDAIPANRPCFDGPWHLSQGAELLVITHPSYSTSIQPWVDWKLLSGIPTKLVTTAVAGTTKEQIKTYIQNAYDTWEIPPSYVLFVGDAEDVPTYEWGGGGIGDGPYGCVDGSDYFPEILTGRMSCDNTGQLGVLVTKHLNFEYSPDTTDDWFARGVGVVNEDGPPYGPDDSSYAAAVIYSMDQCLLAGFSSAPVFRDSLGHSSADVSPFISAGCTFVNYRGQAYPDWYGPFTNLHSLATGRKCPVTVSITCVTGAFQSGDNNLCEVSTRAGSITNPLGSVAWFGQGTVSSNTPERSSLSKHIFEGFFPAGLNELGAAHLYGKIELLAEFGASYASESEYTTTTLIGSPEMRAWTGPIVAPEVIYPAGIPLETTSINISVFVDGLPKVNARVAITQDSLMSYALTDSDGMANIVFAPLPEPLTPIVLVVSGANIYPFFDTLELIIGGVEIFPAPIFFEETVGNGDSYINPGETYSFSPRIVNLGTDTATDLSGRAVSMLGLEWLDSMSSFPPIATWDTVAGDIVQFHVPENYDGPTSIQFDFFVDGHPDGPWYFDFPTNANIYRFGLGLKSIEIADNYPFGDDDDRLDPGEAADIYVELQSVNLGTADSLSAILFSSNDSIIVLADTGFRGEWPGTTSAILEPFFHLDISPELGWEAGRTLELRVIADCNTYTYIDTIPIELPFGAGSVSSSPWLYRYSEPVFQDLGDHDGIIEPGERIGIVFDTKNGGSVDANGVHAGVIATPFVYPDGHTASVGDIPAGAIVRNTYDAITCSTAIYTPAETTIAVPILMVDSGTYSHTLEVLLHVGFYTGIPSHAELPKSIAVSDFRPNPFNGVGMFNIFASEYIENMKISVFDILGHKVVILHDNPLFPGKHDFRFTPPSKASGVYLIKVEAGYFSETFEVVYLK